MCVSPLRRASLPHVWNAAPPPGDPARNLSARKWTLFSDEVDWPQRELAEPCELLISRPLPVFATFANRTATTILTRGASGASEKVMRDNPNAQLGARQSTLPPRRI
jgi:hypothetical protein